MNFDEIVIVPPKTKRRFVVALTCFPENAPVAVLGIVALFFLTKYEWLNMAITLVLGFFSFLLALYGEDIGTTVIRYLMKEFVLSHFSKEKSYSFENNGEFQLVQYDIENW